MKNDLWLDVKKTIHTRRRKIEREIIIEENEYHWKRNDTHIHIASAIRKIEFLNPPRKESFPYHVLYLLDELETMNEITDDEIILEELGIILDLVIHTLEKEKNNALNELDDLVRDLARQIFEGGGI